MVSLLRCNNNEGGSRWYAANPFDRKAREARLADLGLAHAHIAQSIFEFQWALENSELPQICLARESLRGVLRPHMPTSDLNATLRLLEELHGNIDISHSVAAAR